MRLPAHHESHRLCMRQHGLVVRVVGGDHHIRVDIFLGKNTNSTPLDLPESSPVRAAFYSKVTGKEAAQVKATWARLVFSGKAQPPKELPDAAAFKKAVAADAKAVGYIEKSAVDASVKVLTSLD
jgi:hypothetical protein